ncbi:MAG: hypothetical protein RL701_2546 [Pseudomonadota bacterium]|jgi:hypothetical protein
MTSGRVTNAGTVLRFFSTITTLGAALDVTLDELRIESYYPADAATKAALAQSSAYESE